MRRKGPAGAACGPWCKPTSPAVSLGSPPVGLTLGRGRLEVDFANMEELAAAMYWLARALDGDLEGFAKEYEPASKVENSRS